MGTPAPKPVVELAERKTGTVPERGRVLAAGDCPEFSGVAPDGIPSSHRKVFLSPDYKEEQPRDEFLNPRLTPRTRPVSSSHD